MGSKRKRESSVAESPKSIPASTEAHPELGTRLKSSTSKHGGSDVETGSRSAVKKGPEVQYIAAEASDSWSKRLDLERDYAKSLKHIAKKLGLPKQNADKLRLSHVRDGGREVEIYDDFDYQAFKARAVASPGSKLVLKVHGMPGASEAASHGRSVADSVRKAQQGKGKEIGKDENAKAAPVQNKELKKSKTQRIPASRSPVPMKDGESSISKSKQPKSSGTPPQVGSASTHNPPSPHPSPAALSASKASSSKAEKKKKRKSMSDPPSTPSPAPSTPSPFDAARPIGTLQFHNKYKPARPSPLNPNRTAPPLLPVPSPSTTTATKEEGSKRERRKRRLHKKLSARESDGGSQASGMDTPQATPQKEGNGTQQVADDVAVSSSKPAQGEANDSAPPRKRSRKSMSQKLSKTNESSPPPTAPTAAPSTPGSARVTVSDNQIIPPAKAPIDVSTPVHTPASATETLSTKKVVRVSNENYDLKQKPKDASSESSSIVGEKKKKSRKSRTSSVTSSTTAAVSATPSRSTVTDPVVPALAESSTSTLPVVTPVAEPSDSTTATPTSQPSTSPLDLPSTPTSKKGKSKAIPEVDPTTAASDSDTTAPASHEPSSSPLPSSDPPSAPATASGKKRRATKAKNPESSEPTMMQQILQRQRERVAAENAAKAALEATTASPETTPATEATMKMPAVSVAEETAPQVPVSQADAAGSEEPIAPAELATNLREGISVDKEAGNQPAALVEPVSPTPATITEAVQSSEDLVSSLSKSGPATDAPVTPSPPVAEVDVEMREASPQADVAVEPENIPSPRVETADSTADMVVEDDARSVEPQTATDLDVSDAQPTDTEVLVPGTVIPPPTRAASPTASGSKPRSTKGKSRKVDVPCMICLRTPWHIQKDCPEVKEGPSNLRYLLTARQDQHASISTEEDESHFDSSIEAIQEWIERLEMIAGKVQGIKKDGFKPRSPVRVMGNKEGLRLDLNAPDPKKAAKRKAISPESNAGVTESTSQAAETASSTMNTTPVTTAESAQAPARDAQSPPESRPESPMAVPDTYNFPPIHLRAMQKSRRPGSLSGLSVSDAIIETEPSDDSSSDSDDEDEEDEGMGSDTSSVVSDTTDSDSDSDSDGSDSGSSRVVMPSDPSDAMKFSLTRDLSEREKKKARLSAAKMQPVTFDAESVVDDEGQGSLETSPAKSASRPMARTGSDSSIGDFGDADSRRSSIDSNATAPYRSQAPPIIASSALPARSSSVTSDLESIEDPSQSATREVADEEEHEEISQVTPSTLEIPEGSDVGGEEDAAPVEVSSGQRSRSFRELDGTAPSSPDLDDSAGREAVQQGIEDEEGDDEPVTAHQETSSSNPVATQSLSQARRTRSSASAIPDESVIVPASQPLRRSSRTSMSATPQDVMPRRLRSVSRDLVEKTPPPPGRSTRSVSVTRSQSQVPPSPSTPKACRASRTLVSDIEEETPKQTTRRTRVTRSTQPEEPSSFPVEDSQPSQSRSAIERQTQSTPVRRSTRASPSPLFMTQGSQVPATQHYNANPETIPIESSSQPASSETNGRKTRNTKKAASPILEEQEEEEQEEDGDGDINMSPRSTSAHLPPIQHETEEHPTSGQADPADEDEAEEEEEDDEDVEMADAQSQISSDDANNDLNADDEDDLNSIPDIQPPKPRILPPTSSQSTTPIYPSLSSLPKELLRKSWSILSGNNPTTPVSARQAMTNGHANGHGHANGEDSDDSGSSSDSSVEAAQAPPSILKGRFASGGMKKKVKNSQVAGW